MASESRESPDEPDRTVLVHLLTTEEFVLQSTRASTISESSSRASIFLGSVSSGLIAIALSAQLTDIGTPFYVLALTVLPTLVLLGAFTYVRVMQTGIEDLACAHAIERIRRRYGELHPDYLTVMKHSHRESGVAERTRWQLFFTAATVVAGVTSVLAGAVVGLALGYAGERLAISTAGAIPMGIVVLAFFMRDQQRRWARTAEALL